MFWFAADESVEGFVRAVRGNNRSMIEPVSFAVFDSEHDGDDALRHTMYLPKDAGRYTESKCRTNRDQGVTAGETRSDFGV
jgi:hypothetical protein